jgi:hypothetical protein
MRARLLLMRARLLSMRTGNSGSAGPMGRRSSRDGPDFQGDHRGKRAVQFWLGGIFLRVFLFWGVPQAEWVVPAHKCEGWMIQWLKKWQIILRCV